MPAFAIFSVGAALLGVASSVYQAKQQKKAAKKQTAEMARQERLAREAERESAALADNRLETGADIKLGRDKKRKPGQVGDTVTPSTGGATGLANRVGGLGSTSARIGL